VKAYEVLFELKVNGQKAKLEQVIVNAQYVQCGVDWLEFSTIPTGETKTVVAAFPRDKVFGFKLLSDAS